MSWEQLRDITREARQLAEAEQSQPPEACPNDGEPLQRGPHGELHCPSDGWIYQ
jgi:hypothetical protein